MKKEIQHIEKRKRKMSLTHSTTLYKKFLEKRKQENIPDGRQRCTSCGKIKTFLAFGEDSRMFKGFSSHCCVCKAKRNRDVARKISLANKPVCKYEGCEVKVGLGKRAFCSIEHSVKFFSKKSWEKQKVKPGYAEYHRKRAREWQRKKTAELRKKKLEEQHGHS